MNRLDRNERLLAAGIALLAGYIDAIGFVELGGLFVSFMSGNSTRMAVGVAQQTMEALQACGLILSFVAGVTGGALLSMRARGWRRPAVLTLVAGLLAIAGGLAAFAHSPATTLIMAAAMGAVNTVLDHAGDVRVALTYMTGTLVKLGQRLALAMLGRETFGWAPYLFQWLALVAGAIVGAFAYGAMGLVALWPAAAATLAMAAIATRRSFRGP